MYYNLFFSLNKNQVEPAPPIPVNTFLTDLQGYWKFDESSGEQAMDSFVYEYDFFVICWRTCREAFRKEKVFVFLLVVWYCGWFVLYNC